MSEARRTPGRPVTGWCCSVLLSAGARRAGTLCDALLQGWHLRLVSQPCDQRLTRESLSVIMLQRSAKGKDAPQHSQWSSGERGAR